MINKKTLAVVLSILLLCISIMGCSATDDDINESTTESTISSTENSSTPSQTTTSKIDKVSTTIPSTTKAQPTTDSTTNAPAKSTTNTTTAIASTTSKFDATTASKKVEKSTTKSSTSTTQATSTTVIKATEKADVCYISIECDEINKNINNLKAGHKKYVPNDGIILDNYEVEIKDNYTVYDALSKACNDNKINLTSTSTQYGKYIAGINNLDERDCGKYSGWLYFVNGEKPSFACSKYDVKNGDKILFSYTCGE